MTDSITLMDPITPDPKPTIDGSGANVAQQIGIEADRLSGAIKDGVEAAQETSKTYGGLLTETCVRIFQVSMRNGVDVGNHLLALMQAKTPADVMRLNFDFMQRQVSSLQDRFFDMLGVSGAPETRRKVERMMAGMMPVEVRGPERGAARMDGQGGRVIQA